MYPINIAKKIKKVYNVFYIKENVIIAFMRRIGGEIHFAKKGMNTVMDIIAEILSADKKAEDKLKTAEEKKAEMLSSCDEFSEQLNQKSAENIKEYEKSCNKKADSKIKENADRIAEKEKESIDKLDKIYEINHEKWEKEIVDRILAL